MSARLALLMQRNTAMLMHESRAPDYPEWREYFDASLAFECGKPYGAQPWIDGGDMHWGNTDFLVATAMRFCLDMPAQAVPWQHCPCGWHGVEVEPTRIVNLAQFGPKFGKVTFFLFVFGQNKNSSLKLRYGPVCIEYTT
jgi:hypothetical protein